MACSDGLFLFYSMVHNDLFEQLCLCRYSHFLTLSPSLWYSRILDERATVHKEMERLQEDCSSAEGRTKELESRNKDLTSEVRHVTSRHVTQTTVLKSIPQQLVVWSCYSHTHR